MEDTVRQRVKQVVAYYNTTLSGCTDGDNAMQVKLSRQISHDSTITFDTLSFIHKTFPKVSTAWLMYGEGTMLVTDSQDEVINELQEIVAKQTKEIAELTQDKRNLAYTVELQKSLLHKGHEDYIEEKQKKEIV